MCVCACVRACVCVCVPVCVVVLLLLAGCTILVTPLLTSRVKGWSWQMKTTSYSTSQLSCNTEVLFPNTYSVVGLGCPRITSPPLNQKNRGVNARARNRSLCPLAASTQNSSTLFVVCKFCLTLTYEQPPNPLVCHSPSTSIMTTTKVISTLIQLFKTFRKYEKQRRAHKKKKKKKKRRRRRWH